MKTEFGILRDRWRFYEDHNKSYLSPSVIKIVMNVLVILELNKDYNIIYVRSSENCTFSG